MSVAAIYRSKFSLLASTTALRNLFRTAINSPPPLASSSSSSTASKLLNSSFIPLNGNLSFCNCYHDGRPRGSLWRSKKMIGREALNVILGLKRLKDDEEKLEKFLKTHVSRLLKVDMIAVLLELERQQEVTLSLKIFWMIQKEDWYKPDAYIYKDLIIALAKCKELDAVMALWESMKKEDLHADSQTYTEVIRGFLGSGSPGDAMNIYEDMKQSPDPPEELPFRVLLKGLIPHPLLRNKVKQDFEEIFPDSHAYDPPEEIFGLRCCRTSEGGIIKKQKTVFGDMTLSQE